MIYGIFPAHHTPKKKMTVFLKNMTAFLKKATAFKKNAVIFQFVIQSEGSLSAHMTQSRFFASL